MVFSTKILLCIVSIKLLTAREMTKQEVHFSPQLTPELTWQFSASSLATDFTYFE